MCNARVLRPVLCLPKWHFMGGDFKEFIAVWCPQYEKVFPIVQNPFPPGSPWGAVSVLKLRLTSSHLDM